MELQLLKRLLKDWKSLTFLYNLNVFSDQDFVPAKHLQENNLPTYNFKVAQNSTKETKPKHLTNVLLEKKKLTKMSIFRSFLVFSVFGIFPIHFTSLN